MTPIKSGRYEYRHTSLIQLRQRMGLKQKKMAELLEIPANTLSRWENGATTPDADSLAAIYSLAKERGVTAQFFHPRKKSQRKLSKPRTRLLLMWDYRGVPVPMHKLDDFDEWVSTQIKSRFGNTNQRWYKVFVSPGHDSIVDKLHELNWKVWEYGQDLEEELISQVKSDCGQKPTETVFVLIAKEGYYVELKEELTESGVKVEQIHLPEEFISPIVRIDTSWPRPTGLMSVRDLSQQGIGALTRDFMDDVDEGFAAG